MNIYLEKGLKRVILPLVVVGLAALAIKNFTLATTSNGDNINSNGNGNNGLDEQLAMSMRVVSSKGLPDSFMRYHQAVLKHHGIDPFKIAALPLNEVTKLVNELLGL